MRLEFVGFVRGAFLLTILGLVIEIMVLVGFKDVVFWYLDMINSIRNMGFFLLVEDKSFFFIFLYFVSWLVIDFFEFFLLCIVKYGLFVLVY